jgi:hypothetical protein
MQQKESALSRSSGHLHIPDGARHVTDKLARASSREAIGLASEKFIGEEWTTAAAVISMVGTIQKTGGSIEMFINIVRWRVPKESSGKMLDVWSDMMEYQRSHSRYFHYTRSRFFVHSARESSEEDWMFLDEYERREDYDKWMKFVRDDPEMIRLMSDFFPKWDALTVPGSKKSETWTEIEELRAVLKNEPES